MKKAKKNFTTEHEENFQEEVLEEVDIEEEIFDDEEDIDEDIDDYDEDDEDYDDDVPYNRRNVNGIKRMLVVMLLFMCAVPILFCLYLLVKMNGIERKVDLLLENQMAKKAKKQNQLVVQEDSSLDKALLDQNAYLDLDKNTESSNHSLAATKDGDSYQFPKQNLNGKRVYLTFDDGPSQYTGEILDILDKNDVKATFFVVKSEDEQYWKYYDQIVERGHTLAMHSYTHVYEDVYKSKESFINDVENIHDFLYDETGVDCRYYRFPGGSSNSVSDVDISEFIEYLDSRGITYFDWNALSGDSVDDEATPEELNETVLDYVRSNEEDSIVLLHDLDYKRETVDGLQQLIDTLKEEGYQILPIDMTTKPVQHYSE